MGGSGGLMPRKRSPSPDTVNLSQLDYQSHLVIRRRPQARYRRHYVEQETVREWAICYEKLGFTIDRIAQEFGVSYSRVRKSLIEHGVEIRRQGAVGLRLSPLARIAKLEERVAELERWVTDAERHILDKQF